MGVVGRSLPCTAPSVHAHVSGHPTMDPTSIFNVLKCAEQEQLRRLFLRREGDEDYFSTCHMVSFIDFS